jgi:hypothetical protein
LTGWADLLRAAQAPTAALQDALRDPRQAQSALLRRILSENADTEVGRRHGFARLATPDDYRAAVPIAGYDAFRPFMERIAAGEQRLLTSAPVIAFEETGGTASGGKLIAYTAESLAGFRAAILPWLADLTRRRPGVKAGSAYVSISPATRQPRRTAGGIAVGLVSEASYLGEDLAGAFLSTLAVPPELALIRKIDEWRIATLAHLIERDDLSFVSVWSPTFFLELIEALRGTAEDVARLVGRPARARLAAALSRPDIDTTRLWPRLDTVSCWADGSSRVFARQLAALCPQASIEPKGLFATEAAITLPWTGGDGGIPALTSAFLEFIDRNGCSLLAHELQTDVGYRIVVTTAGGLYRYDTGDQVRCIARNDGVPRLVFEGRCGLVSDLVGEKLDEAFVSGVLARLPLPAMLTPKSEPKPHYELRLDGAGDLREMGALVEAGLRANPQYAYAHDLGQLGPVRSVADPGFSARQNRARAIGGRRMGDHKHVSLCIA